MIVDPGEVFLTMRLLRALRAIDEQRGANAVEEAIDWAWQTLRERDAEIRDARFYYADPIWLRKVKSLTGSSPATIEAAAKAILRPNRITVAVEAIEAFAAANGISLTRKVAG